MKLVLVNFLSFIAGYINALSVLCFAVPITHITGTLTKISLLSSQTNSYSPFFYVYIILAYIFGAMLSGKCFKLGIKYLPIAFFIMAVIMVSLLFLMQKPTVIVVILALLSGFQNAIPLKFNQSAVRTTHFSGTLTDIGILLGKNGIVAFKNQLFVMQLTSVIAFVIGGSSVLLLPANVSVLFIVCAILYVMLSILTYNMKRGFDE